MRLAPLATGLALVLSTGSACKSKSDKDQIEALVDRAIAAANEKKAGGVVEDATDDFEGPNKADLAQSRRILVGFFLRQGWLKVFKRSTEVTVEGETATAKVEVVVAQGKPVEKIEDVVPTNAGRLRFDVKLAKRDSDWKITHATYKRLRL